MTKIAILLGNGVFDSNIANYKNYVDEFVDFVNRNKIEYVFLCGGRTNPNIKITEAASLRKYIAPKLRKDVEIELETKSITASQSIRFLKPIIKIKPKDDITIFCDALIEVKVMWFVMHYWFGMSKREIAADALDFVKTHYNKQHTISHMGKWISATGVLYKNVEIHPCTIQTSVSAAIAQQLVSLVDIGALYDQKLYKQFIDATKSRYKIDK